MVFDFVYSHTKVLKKDFFEWLKTTMVNHGWNYLSEGRSQDGHVFHSTGESGNENIGVHIRTYYGTNTTRHFHTTTYGYISANPFHKYTPSPTLTGLGTFEPSVSPPTTRISATMSINSPIDIYYHINKDRIIFITKSNDNSSSTTATFNLFGKPYTLAMTDEYCHSAIIGSHLTGGCISGMYNHNSKGLVHTYKWEYADLSSGGNIKGDNKQIVSDLALWNNGDGYKYILENVFVTNFNNSMIRNTFEHMERDVYTDSNGYIYKLFANKDTTNISDNLLSVFLIRVG